jgi:hypothetical protein
MGRGDGSPADHVRKVIDATVDLAWERDWAAVSTALASGCPASGQHSRDSTTVLHWAARQDDVDMVCMALRRGANASLRDGQGCTPVFYAACHAGAPVLQALVDGGGDVNATNCEGEAPVHAVLRRETRDVMECLLVLVAQPGLALDVACKGVSPLVQARRAYRMDCAAVIEAEVRSSRHISAVGQGRVGVGVWECG